MTIFHDSRSPLYRQPFGAAACGQKLTLRVRAEEARAATLRLWWREREILLPMKPSKPGLFTCELTLPDEPGLLWYYFKIEDEDGKVWFFGNAPDGLGGAGQTTETEPASYQVTVYDAGYAVPKWLREGVMMQIMVDRFHASQAPDPRRLSAGSYYHLRWDDDPVLVADDRSGDYTNNDYFGGDLRGVEQKLDYLQDLGVTVIYLNPIFQASSNHKYNTGDYHKIDPAFGTEEDFRSLCASAKARGIRVILDGVFSHTGSDSVYFNRNGTYGEGGAYRDPDSPYAPWYRFERWPDRYDCWWGVKTLPNVNEMEPSFRRFVFSDKDGVLAHWTRAGASGWRLDVADELPMSFLRELRACEKKLDPDAAVIGEVWEDPSNKVAYGETRCYCLGDTLDSTMNYPLRDAALGFLTGKIGAPEFVRRVQSMQENLPKPFFYSEMNLLGSHDKPRALTVLAEAGDLEPERRFRHAFDLPKPAYERGRRRLIAAWNLICALPGMPCVYYGDEAGLYGMTDPFCRGTYPWGREDAALVEAFREAIHRRRKSHALRTGALSLAAFGEDVVLVAREIESEDAFGQPAAPEVQRLAVNRASKAQQIEWEGVLLNLPPESAVWMDETRKESVK